MWEVEFTEFGFKYFCPDYVSKIGVSVMELNTIEQKELDDFLDKNLSSGRIHPSKSPMASPVFFVKKQDRKLQFVQDYQKLNAMTVGHSMSPST